MLLDNLEALEQWVYQIKAMLKEPDYHIFEDLKKQTLDQVLTQQRLLNPNAQVKTASTMQPPVARPPAPTQPAPQAQPQPQQQAVQHPLVSCEILVQGFKDKGVSRLTGNTAFTDEINARIAGKQITKVIL